MAKNIVAAGLARRCHIELAYAIGVSEPVSVLVDTRRSVDEYRQRGLDIRVDAAGSFESQEEAQAWQDMAAQAFPGEEIQYDPLSLSRPPRLRYSRVSTPM